MNADNHFSRPESDEMLSSWLKRVAIDLGFGSAQDLLQALAWPVCKTSEIDFACPEPLLRKISEITDTDLLEVHRQAYSSTKKISLSIDQSFMAEKTGYIWGRSSREITRQVVLLSKIGCGSLIIKRPIDSSYDQFQRELAFRELLRTPTGGSFALARYESLALGLDELIIRLKKAASEKIIVHFAETQVTIFTRKQVEDLRKEIARSNYDSEFIKARNPSKRVPNNGVLSHEDQLFILEAYRSGEYTVSQLCLQYGVSYAPIYRCLHRMNGNNGLPEISGSTKRRAGRVAGRNKLANNTR